jgi:hypothetical protein
MSAYPALEVMEMVNRSGVAIFFALAFALGCASPSLGPSKRAPMQLAPAPEAGALDQAADPFPNWPIDPAVALDLLRHGDAEIRSIKAAGGGTTGAEQHEVFYSARNIQFKVKWKSMPVLRLDGFNNSPRKEIAAFAIQRLFLDPEDYVAPSATMRCYPLASYRETHPLASATLDEIDCVLGVASVWVFDVTLPEKAYDEQRFVSDRAYATFMSNLNVFTYILDHRDGREGNFLIAKDASRPQTFSIDNGIAFGPLFFNYFVPNWNKLRVAAVRASTIDRLREIERKDLDYLLVVDQLQVNDQRMLAPVPSGAVMDSNDGATFKDGVVQFGLTTREIDGVYKRIRKLVGAVDSGRIPVF